MKPSFLNLFMRKLTRVRVVPIISASISCDTLGTIFLRLGFLAVASKQQKSPSQPFLAGVKKLIDQIFLDPDVPRKNVRHEAVGERMLRAENAHHLVFFDDQYSRGRNRGGRPHANTLTSQASLTKEVGGPQYPHDCLFADLISGILDPKQ